ncbi:MAG: Phosphoribosyltransferase [Parcubacteria group bacterium GW2011_GWA1_44_13]|uniref:Phosphoribosyltransferase n=1 Tax=Candidatus Nomurabacteria bacterium GW2011_GWB1_44_12 TaxID=1618748 RepID=A0A837ICI3_9BACT|nr:MAG: Phosphoribosyltransferase [Candidatus Nomurabacteria bacterium GW2011_GWB1_44_12]KKT38448.1 MAG: Phosphoribosyltransferase [Parcubacteria group bacterium GW2011_GWA1_44_13]HBB44390.1 phosphoribosyl transferase [Candidatus Yonathbacteria bacterium]
MTVFKNRIDAGAKLAEILIDLKNADAIVLALPRGGVVIGKEVAQALGLPLDIIVTRKIGAPGNDEYAIGAIDITGAGVWNEAERAYVDPKWLEHKIESEKKEAIRRFETYRKGMGQLSLKNKTVIIVDDGIATGLTMQSATAYAKREGALKVVVAVPVASTESVRALKSVAEVRILETPIFFSAVGEWYEDFPQVSDQEVIRTLATH